MAVEFQHFQCELSEYNQKYVTLITNSHLFVHSNLRSRTPQLTMGERVLWSVRERAAGEVLCPWKTLLPPTRRDEKSRLPWNWEPSSPSLQWEWATGSTLSAAGHYYCEKDPSLGCPFKCLLNGTLLRATANQCVCASACVGRLACIMCCREGLCSWNQIRYVWQPPREWAFIEQRVCVCQVTVLTDSSVFVQDTNSHMADISGSVSITLCGVEAPDSAGVPPEGPRGYLALGGCPRVCLVMWSDRWPARTYT